MVTIKLISTSYLNVSHTKYNSLLANIIKYNTMEIIALYNNVWHTNDPEFSTYDNTQIFGVVTF